MIFADKLIALRKQNNLSQEELAEKLEVSRQTISKWEGAQSVPDLGRMLKLSELFEVTTDYLMKDSLEEAELSPVSMEADGADVRRVDMEQASAFLHLRDVLGSWIALGVMLCILCPVPLVLLCGAQEVGLLTVSEDFVTGLGCLLLFLHLAVAIAFFLHGGMKLHAFEFLEREPIETAYGVDGMVRERQSRYAPRHTRLLITGILLCVLSPTPIFTALILLGEENELAMNIAPAALLVMVGIGVLCIVRTCMVWGSFQMLLEEEDYTRERKLEARRNSAIAGIYWGVVTALYLGYSFLTGDWDRSWVIWPVAGVAYGVLECILRIVRKNS